VVFDEGDFHWGGNLKEGLTGNNFGKSKPAFVRKTGNLAASGGRAARRTLHRAHPFMPGLSSSKKNSDEIRRLLSGPNPGEMPAGRLVRLHVGCARDAMHVHQSLRELWATVLWQPVPERLSLAEWRLILPGWFVEKLAPEIQTDDPLLRRAFQLQDRMRPADAWTLGAWVRTLGSGVRRWQWWSAAAVAPHGLELTVDVTGEGEGIEALHWLLRCAGAESIEARP
jgi:hypothetical protein